MKKTLKIKIFFSIVLMVFNLDLSAAFTQVTRIENIQGNLDGNVLCLEKSMFGQYLYAGTDKGLYVRKKAGTWAKTDHFPGNIEVLDIAFYNKELFLLTNNGIYKEKNEDVVRLVIRQKDLKGILTVSFPDSDAAPTVYTWSLKNIFELKDGNIENITPEALKGEIVNIIENKGTIFAATGERVYILPADTCAWKEVFFVKSAKEDDIEEEDDFSEEENFHDPGIRGVEISTDGGCIVCTDKGLFIVDGSGSINKRIDITGFPANNIVCAVQTETGILASTGEKVFIYDPFEEVWQVYFENVYPGKISFLKVFNGTGTGNGAMLYAAIGNKILEMGICCNNAYRLTGNAEEDIFIKEQRHGPSIRTVQTMAVKYAEVSPEKINAWRTGAKWKAVMPKLSLRYSESIDDNIEIYKSASNHYVVSAPKEIDNDWSVDLSWDLSEIIWSSAQTSIDVRSKLMVQLRNDILEDLTRLYFERQRTLDELSMLMAQRKKEKLPVSDRTGIYEKILRIQELNSYIDALTGGKFSEALSEHK